MKNTINVTNQALNAWIEELEQHAQDKKEQANNLMTINKIISNRQKTRHIFLQYEENSNIIRKWAVKE